MINNKSRLLIFAAILISLVYNRSAQIIAINDGGDCSKKDNQDHKVTFCHSTSSAGNPYTQNETDVCSLKEGHDDHQEDIIPPFSYLTEDENLVQYPGKNWTSTNQQILTNNCNLFTPTPTMVPSPTSPPCCRPTATNTPTPTSIPQDTPTLTPTNTPTNTPTTEPTATLTPSATPTLPDEPTEIPTPTISLTQTPTPTGSPTATPTVTSTPTPTLVPTATIAPSPTNTPTSAPNVGGDNGSPEGNNPPVCNDSVPNKPENLRARYIGGGKVVLSWNHPSTPHTSYILSFGTSSGSYQFGNPDLGNVDSYTVESLTSSRYCFVVQSKNGCMPGGTSDEVCLNLSGGSSQTVLGVSDNFNPLIQGIEDTQGDILGAMTELAATADTVFDSRQKLPTNNVIDENHLLSVPKINLETPVSKSKVIGGNIAVGQKEVLFGTIGNNLVYYAHNATDMFSQLYRLNNGDKVTISRNGSLQEYQVSDKKYLSEKDVDYFNTPEAGSIYLVTCSVSDPDTRIVVKASVTK